VRQGGEARCGSAMRLGHFVPNRKGKLVLKLKRTGDFDMTNSAFPTLRQRQLLADGVPIELGTRAFELLLVLLEANGSLISKEQLLARVWPRIVVAEHNLKVQVCALRKALGEDRDYTRAEFGHGYRFIAAVHSTVAWSRPQRPLRWRHESTQELLPRWTSRRPSYGWSVDCVGRDVDLARGAGAASCRDQTA
jgi:DNA-binding winged helix-turn-helix (wHTH) protein